MQFAEASRWLEGLINREHRPEQGRVSLAPVRALLARVGNPQQEVRALHIAGSKGKGATALLAEALLQELGVRSGTLTSPHLLRLTERFRIDGVEVPEPRLAGVLTRLRPEVEVLQQSAAHEPPSFFDVLTAAAFLLFREADVAFAILEVGLGGRLDSTNVCRPVVTCITSIELEHTRQLGDTRAAIAGEKAGIAKPGVPLYCGALAPEALARVRERAAEAGAPLRVLGSDFHAQVLNVRALGSRFAYRDGRYQAEFELGAAGVHQVGNAALALACVRALGVARDPALTAAAHRAFQSPVLPGRIEVMGRRPWLIVDAAHTAASARALARVLAALPKKRVELVLSCSADKDVDALSAALAPLADRATATLALPQRSLAPHALAEALHRAHAGLRVEEQADPRRALAEALARTHEGDLLCATGSVYLAGIARAFFEERER